jgi:hypothetical protein
LALSQGNKSVGFVKRLSDCVSFHANSFSHRSTSNGLLLSAAILT